MKRIDRYVVRLFLIFYLATLAGFITMMVVVDLSGKVGKFGSKGNFIVNFVSHYVTLLPPLLNLLLPIIAVMAAIFTLVSLKRRNELVCLLASGVSIHRIMGGICIVLLLTVPLFYINSEIIVPYISRMKTASDDEILITTIITEKQVSLASVNRVANDVHAEDFNLTIIDRETGQLDLFLYTPAADWDTKTDAWVFQPQDLIIKTREGTSIDASELGGLLTGFDRQLFPSPERLAISTRPPARLSIRELLRIMPSRHAEIEIYHRLGFPFIMFLLLLMALPFSADQDRNVSVFIGVGIGLATIFIMYGVMFLAVFMGGKEMLPPWAAGLAPFFVFTAPAVLLYRKIKT